MLPPDLLRPEIGPDGIAVYAILCTYAERETGECYPSQKTIAERLGICRERVIAALKRLERHGFVVIKTKHGFQRNTRYILTRQINESRESPLSELKVGNPDNCMSEIATSESRESRQELTINRTKETIDTPKPKRATRIPDDFTPTEKMISWAASEGFSSEQVAKETKKFINYWRAKSKDAVKLDWPRTWQNWFLSDYVKPDGGKKREGVFANPRFQ